MLKQLLDAPRILFRSREHALRRQHQRAAVALEGFKGGYDAQHADGEQSQPRVGRYVQMLQRGKLAQQLPQCESMMRFHVIEGREKISHKAQRLQGAVGPHSICNGTSAGVADLIAVLQKNCGSVEFRK